MKDSTSWLVLGLLIAIGGGIFMPVLAAIGVVITGYGVWRVAADRRRIAKR